MALKVRKGSTVTIITGSDKGKKGEVIEVNSTKMLVKVRGVRIQTHYDKKDGMLKKEGFISYSNVRLDAAAAAKTKEPKKARATKAK